MKSLILHSKYRIYKLIFRPSFVQSVKEIKKYYEEQNLSVFRDFKVELNMLLDNVENFPKLYSRYYKDIRIGFMSSFSYGVHYQIVEDKIILHTVLHTSRKPKH